MTDQHEHWQERLKKGPFKEEPFTEEHKQRVIQTVQNLTPHSQHKPRPWQWRRMLLTLGISGAVLASVWWIIPNGAVTENIASLSDQAVETSQTESMDTEFDTSPNQKNNYNASSEASSPTSSSEQSTHKEEAATETEDRSGSASENVEEQLITQQGSATTGTTGSAESIAVSYSSFEDLLADSVLAAEIEVLDAQSDPYEVEVKDVLYSTTVVTPGEEIKLNYTGVKQGQENAHAEDSYNPPLTSGDHAILFLKKGGNSDPYYIAGVYQGNYMVQQGKVSSVGSQPSTEELELVQKDSGTSRFVIDMELTEFKDMLRTIAKK
ncbi:hypothetical protein [Paenibacillus sp. 453mf]|uniref:hypothetical protein n=1 Tax=Paenibacillus sp. 453mf TaxID=1761874 RepID=UPI0008F2095B|nr:hypothetical protein [Paenibacillus sp. 453mf]SFS70307.1 hypothetical protein SAMN04488601_10290 [Paenibacillus sp. 453mf]